MDPTTDTTLQERLELCQERIGYRFRDPNLLQSALTHASGASSRLASNERMEFLGDAVLGFTICEKLFREHEEYLEGELTQIKSAVVSRRVCARVSRELDLEECLILGKGMQQSPAVPRSLLSDVYEAIIAAIYLDGGIEAAQEFIIRTIGNELAEAVEGHSVGNYKSALQQISQRDHGAAPTYRLVCEKGPDHSKLFQISAEIKKRKFTPAWGKTKKDAEQRAAGNAIAELQGDPPALPGIEPRRCFWWSLAAKKELVATKRSRLQKFRLSRICIRREPQAKQSGTHAVTDGAAPRS